jgi:hypothetical protein
VEAATEAGGVAQASGVVGRLIAVLVVVGIVLGTSWYVKTQVIDEAVDDAKTAFGISGDLAVAPTLRGDDPRSLYAPANLRGALALLDDALAGGVVTTLKVEPGALKATALDAAGNGRVVQVGADGKVLVVEADVPGDGFAVERIDPAVPGRIIVEAIGRAGAGIADVSYLVASLDVISGELGWNVYLTAGSPQHFSADEHGGALTAPGG